MHPYHYDLDLPCRAGEEAAQAAYDLCAAIQLCAIIERTLGQCGTAEARAIIEAARFCRDIVVARSAESQHKAVARAERAEFDLETQRAGEDPLALERRQMISCLDRIRSRGRAHELATKLSRLEINMDTIQAFCGMDGRSL